MVIVCACVLYSYVDQCLFGYVVSSLVVSNQLDFEYEGILTEGQYSAVYEDLTKGVPAKSELT